MAKSIKLKNDTYWDSSGVSHNREKLSDVLPRFQDKIAQNRNAWTGTTNKINIQTNYYGWYLVISQTPWTQFSVYTICVLNGNVQACKIAGTHDSAFSISGNTLSVTLSEANYWNTFVLYLGTAW